MQVLRLLAARRADAVRTTITAPSEAEEEEDDDEGPFFDLDFASVRAASSSSSAGSASSGPGSESDDAFSDLDLVISLHRSRSASPSSYEAALAPPPLLTPSAGPRSLSLRFGASTKAAHYGGRPSSARSSSSSSSSGARSLRLFMEAADREGAAARPYSGDVIRRCLTRISRRLRRGREDGGGTLRRLRKSRSAGLSSASRRDDDDSVAEKQDGIASAIAHCKESLHRASLSTECDSPLLRSRSDPGKREPEGSELAA